MSKTIVIDGQTYTGIESVSVNGNVFVEGSSEYTEEIIRRDYSPNGRAFIDNVSIDLTRGDYIEAKIDATHEPVSRIAFGIGEDISVWPSSAKTNHVIYVYANVNVNDALYWGVSYLHSTKNTVGNKRATCKNRPMGDNTGVFKISAAGIWFNDVLMTPSEFSDSNDNTINIVGTVMSKLLSASTLQVGAAQSDTEFSYAHYDYIKVVRKVS